MNSCLERSKVLKERLLNFVLDAEGDIAIALEAFSAKYLATWSTSQHLAMSQNDLVVDMFLTEGRIGHETPISLFLAEQTDLSEGDRQLLAGWSRGFNGLFVVTQVQPDSFDLMNWLTAKHYQVEPNGLQPPATLARLQVGEICLTRILPLTDAIWTFSGPIQLLGKLGKPKLAVAIGHFKDRFKQHLYGDAPDLLEEAWQSVERYHQEFIEFFGGNEVTMPGRVLHTKLNEFQDISVKRRLESAGLDSSQSIETLVEQTGRSSDDIIETVATLGTEQPQTIRALKDQTDQLAKGNQSEKMVMPDIKLPDTLRNADHVTVIVDCQWGQNFLTDYHQLVTNLAALSHLPDSPAASISDNRPDAAALAAVDSVLKRYLHDPSIHIEIWHRLAHRYPVQLEVALRRILDRPDWSLNSELDETLASLGKLLTPELPEIASVPLHLHHLFQDALVEVNGTSSNPKNRRKNKAKDKRKPKRTAGFGI